MPDLNKKLFQGESDISTDRVKDLLTEGNSDSINNTLTKLGWEGQLVAAVILQVSADGKRADDGHFSLRGPLCAEATKLQAAKLWEKADESVILQIDMPPGESFIFEGGNFASVE